MVPLRFFRSSTFTGANLDAFAVSFLIAGVAFAFTLYLQNVHGFSAVRAGMAILPLVAVMMVGAPISGALVNRVGARILISVGMLISGLGMLLFLRAGVDGTYLDILPGYLVLGLGNSLIFAPMTTAVLNSVESAKSGVASAVNGSIREIGNSFGIALLGTLMNRAYRGDFDGNPTVAALRGAPDPAVAQLRPLVDQVGEGVNYAGRAVNRLFERVGLDPASAAIAPVADGLRRASSEAFIVGMDRAIVISAGGIMVASVISFFLIEDRVATATAPDPVAAGDPALQTTVAD
jgi:MFS family permease